MALSVLQADSSNKSSALNPGSESNLDSSDREYLRDEQRSQPGCPARKAVRFSEDGPLVPHCRLEIHIGRNAHCD